MIKDIEEESKTKFSIKVEFSFSFKGSTDSQRKDLQFTSKRVIIHNVLMQM